MGLREAISRIANVFRPEPGVVLPPETSLLSIAELVPSGFRHGIEILNDNTTPMQFVVDALGKHANLGQTDAVRAMLEVHSKGGKLLPTDTFESAKRIAEALVEDASKHKHPLVCRAVSRGSPPNNSFERTREG